MEDLLPPKRQSSRLSGEVNQEGEVIPEVAGDQEVLPDVLAASLPHPPNELGLLRR